MAQIVGNAELRLGTQGWSYPDWLGAFYPPESKPKDYLAFYGRCFDTVELDTTFYHVPAPGTVRGWAAATPAGFQFAAKLPQTITHEKRLKGAEEDLAVFLEVMRLLGDKLGPLLIQLPPDFHFEEFPALEAFVALLPPDLQFAAEFRHRSWIREEVFELLRAHRIAWCIIDLYYMPRIVRTTTDFAYVRWMGDRRRIERFDTLQIDRSKELASWADAIQEIGRQVQRIYAYFNNHYAGHSPGSIRQLQELLGLPGVQPRDHWERSMPLL